MRQHTDYIHKQETGEYRKGAGRKRSTRHTRAKLQNEARNHRNTNRNLSVFVFDLCVYNKMIQSQRLFEQVQPKVHNNDSLLNFIITVCNLIFQ